MGSFGQSEYEAVLAWLSGELGFSASNSSSSSASGVSAGQGAVGVQVSSFWTLALGRGFKVDKCREKVFYTWASSTALMVCTGWGMWDGTLLVLWGCGGLARTDGLGRLEMVVLGLGIWDGLAKHCCLWEFGDGPVTHCCLWEFGDGLEKHGCLWEFCCCWAGG